MKKILLSFFSAFIIFTLSAQISENFEDYTVGGKLAQQAQAMGRDYWSTWSNAPGGNEDGVVAELNGSKVLKVTAEPPSENDQILRLGTKNGSTWDPRTSGAWELTFNIYIPATKDGYFNIKSVFPSTVNGTWAMQIYFATDQGGTGPGPYTPGVGVIYGGSSDGTTFTFSHDTWIPIKVFIDLDDDVAEFYVNDNLIHTYQYSTGSFGDADYRSIAAMNIFPPSESARSTYYVDDIVFASAGNTVLFESNFDELTTSDYVAQSYPDWWTTWDDNPGTSEDAKIVTEQALSTPNSAKCDNGTDLMFKAGDKTSGVYTIDFDMYIPNTVPAYFNILHFFDPGSGGQDSEWAIGIYMNIPSRTSGMPVGTNLRVGNNLTPFTVPSSTWFPVSFYIDLDNDEAKVSINNVDLLTWQFSLIESGGTGEKQLGRMDFYPPTANSVFYLDNFVYAALSEVETFPIINVTPTSLSETLPVGGTVAKPISVTNTGTSIGDYSSWVEFDFAPPTGSSTFTLSQSNCVPPVPPLEGGIGFTNADNWTVELAQKFLAADLCGKLGTKITKLAYYLTDNIGGNKLTFRVYAPYGNNTGDILAEATLNNPVANAWNEVTFSTPVLINRSELWLSVEFIHLAATYPMGFGIGETVKPDLNFYKISGGSWSVFSDPQYGNWLIKGTAEGGVYDGGCWLSTSGDTYGSIPKGTTKTFNANFNATGLAQDAYNATIYVATSDEANPLFTIPCTLIVGEAYKVTFLVLDEETELPISDATIVFDGETISGYEVPFAFPGNHTYTVSKDGYATKDGSITVVDKDEVITVLLSKLGVDDFSLVYKIYPNPVTSNFVVDRVSSEPATIHIFNAMGMQVATYQTNEAKYEINVEKLATGAYFIRVIEGKYSSVKSFVKQ